METLGAYAILLAFCLSIYAFAASVGGKLKRKPFLIVSGERAVYGVFVLLTTAAGILVYSLLISDFRLAYVAARSNRAMPLVYKFAAWWGGQEGSLLLWSWLLSTFAAVVVFTNRRKHRDMMPYVIAVLTFTQIFFCILNAFVEPPFQVLAVGKGVQAVADGNGLNPLLQYWLMAIHPPALYLGYVGFIVPFAFAFARWSPSSPARPGSHHAPLALITWGFQSVGVMLGQGWAYAVLGWGGYWGWDPVENASLLPDHRHRLSPLRHDAGKGHDEGLEYGADLSTFFLCIFRTF